MNTEASPVASRPVVVTTTKSVGIQILLVVFFGPLGLFYSTIKGALIMLFAVPIGCAAVLAVTGFGTAGSASPTAVLVAVGSEVFLMILGWWLGSFIWGVMAVNSYNRKLLRA